MKLVNAWSAACVAALALTGCGGDSKGSSCGGGTPCGGDLIGKWSVKDVCMDASALLEGTPAFDKPECKDAMSVRDVGVSGTYEFRADNTMSLQVSMNLTMGLVLSNACLHALGSTVDASATLCSQFAQQMNDDIAKNPGSPLAHVSCSASGGGCDCDVQGTPQSSRSAGNYSVNGTSFTDSDNDTSGYCVSGDTLKVFAPETSKISGTIVLERQ